ncbi:tRNA threonylcarbamoyl adenosine modification protein YeaZ [Microbacteriaceae bacterium SG_E_30_P1]|uniref:tRNA threonylcarbamoyl adenosine modification protein YeaZ n=1 Tax=Antiquaquibacter oligotrophicus TaxID=2880260 RepID=A0ABT6KL85_9MICO|nr:tRNA (adenosine(37)-N6)-threonylcarbamoyltransferase complex dimerization subunit type 1 TsaB [Antiquaquibacter oligotrophicus]MDH6179949.1 tRNA threonylcarbamoyl adenosine modification protein YeaZ [Antiquaquibacter oligotrophicus]UDF14292.1 tRNA (adenosine(37)-N6)-threonylcarbamoyltransferase complex dimerization subunit type 1 TsaB [Antiquaquibacter oligotrophicus]
MLLAIDTSVGTSVAIVDRDLGTLAVASSPDTRGHAELIGVLIDECLRDSGIAVTELSGVVAGMGPGPFTGLRVGIAAARAFAFGTGVPVVPLASHDAVAFGEDEPIVVTTDARRRELFYSVYSGSDDAGLPLRVEGPALAKAEGFVAPAGHHLIHATSIDAASLGHLAETWYAVGRPFPADEPLYLRSPDVTISAGPKRVTG